MFCSALHLGRRYIILSGSRKEEDSDIDGGECIAAKEVEGEKKAVSYV